MHHLHVVAGATGPDVRAAWLAINMRTDPGEDRLQVLVCLRRASGHDARSVQGSLLAAGDAGADVLDPARLDLSGAPDRIGEVRVAAVDQDVFGFQVR